MLAGDRLQLNLKRLCCLQTRALINDIRSRMHFWGGSGRSAAKTMARKFSAPQESPKLGTSLPIPCLHVVMLVTGTRGDVQACARPACV